jgi:hypothetical protein
MKGAATNVIESWKAAEHAKMLKRANDLEKRNSELDGAPPQHPSLLCLL